MKVYLCVEMADELANEFMQVIRDFDMKHDPDHEDKVRVISLAEADWPKEKFLAMMRSVTPAPQFIYEGELPETHRGHKRNRS